jgi:hypothetical protein
MGRAQIGALPLLLATENLGVGDQIIFGQQQLYGG